MNDQQRYKYERAQGSSSFQITSSTVDHKGEIIYENTNQTHSLPSIAIAINSSDLIYNQGLTKYTSIFLK